MKVLMMTEKRGGRVLLEGTTDELARIMGFNADYTERFQDILKEKSSDVPISEMWQTAKCIIDALPEAKRALNTLKGSVTKFSNAMPTIVEEEE